MVWFKRSLKVITVLVFLSFVIGLYAYSWQVGFVAKWMKRRHRSTKRVCPVIRSPGEDAKKPAPVQTRKDWSKDCVISNTDDVNSSRRNSCLRKLDLSEEIGCDTSCQESIQRYRKTNLRNACGNNSKRVDSSIWDNRGNLRKYGRKRLHHLFPIENSKIIFCYIPKDGCTAWKRILLTVAGHISSPSFQTDDIHHVFKTKLRSLASYGVKEAQKRLNTYKKFLFVREPLERLLSLFLDKAVNQGKLPFNESQYENFLKFIIKQPPVLFVKEFTEHWAHASHLCLPCDIRYDFIGRLETSKRDTRYIFDHFIHKNLDRLEMYHEPDHPTNSSDSDKKKKYYQQVSKDILRKAIEKYNLDYALFNYDKPLV